MLQRFIIITLLLGISSFAFSQWSSTSTTAPIYRSGNVGIGSSATPRGILDVSVGNVYLTSGNDNSNTLR